MAQPSAWFSILVVLTGCAPSPQPGAHSQRHFEWAIPDRADVALIEFAFAPPYNTYAGEIRKAEGRLRLRSGTDVAEGHFMVRIADVDMGDAELTQNVQTAAEMLRGRDFPTATFTVHSAKGAEQLIERAKVMAASPAIHPRSPIEVKLRGDFSLKGVTVPLTVPIVCDVSPDVNQLPSLRMDGEFSVESLVARYGIAGPAPSAPEGDRVLVRFRFEMTPQRAKGPDQ